MENSGHTVFSDRTNVDPETFTGIMRELLVPGNSHLVGEREERNGPIVNVTRHDETAAVTCSRELLENMLMPTGTASSYCATWMSNYFNLVGDHNPNSNEIHLEKQDKIEIYRAYRAAYEDILKNDEIVTYSYFLRLWETMFNHVRVREYNAVTGKCHYCAVLTALRTEGSRKKQVKARVTDMHALHRATYMMERKKYYENMRKAVDEPESIILDGMAKNHTVLPHIANMKQFSAPLGTHLQGVIEHSQSFTMYRTFANVNDDSNLAIHCILRQLEARIERFGKLPPTIFIQIDGGSENANTNCIYWDFVSS
jgi:hypothetical protein